VSTREAVADPGRPAVRQGLISKGLTAVAQAIKWLIFSLVFSIVVEWIGMTFWWEDQGLEHSRTMLAREIGYLDADFARSLVTFDSARFAKVLADGTYHYLFDATRFVSFVEWVSPTPNTHETGLRPTLHNIYRPIAKFIIAVMQVTQVFSVRLAILALATPLFLLFSVLALVDGLVRRDLRRWGGGRESSFVYHYAKKAAVPLMVLAWVVYLSLPVSVHPSFVILPFATLFALAVAVTASSFKKYL